MNRAGLGVALRLLGPLVQVVGLVLLLGPSKSEDAGSILGVSLNRLGVICFLTGLGMVGLGLLISMARYLSSRRTINSRNDLQL